jgi:glycosyltransferase involved in cell wall biosynthesis
MVEIGIPVYNAADTLPKTLDSLVSQTVNDFCVCLSIDGDFQNWKIYENLFNEYQKRGLKMRMVSLAQNCGPGAARQLILDSTQCDYIMFLDADDMLMPRAVEVLYQQAKVEEYDIIRSSFIREDENGDYILPQNMGVITWFHGKIYRVAFLKEKNINFLTELRTDEDAYFNLIAWNTAEKRGELEEVTYIWRYNKNSLTRARVEKDYFSDTYMYYIISQVEGLKKLYEINRQISDDLISQTLLNIYYYYMKGRFYKIDETEMDNKISELRAEQWMQDYLNKGENWIYIIQHVKAGDFYENSSVVFFNESFNFWAKRLLKAEDASV